MRWPFTRVKRLLNGKSRVLDLVAARLRSGGYWHLATDWAEYADTILACFADDPRWTGGVIERPDGRPETRYERRALREGREVVDLRFRMVDR